MKTVLMSIALTFSTFSRLPVPKAEWREENMRYLLAALPLVALPIGLLLLCWTALCALSHFTETLYAAGIALLPLAITGGVHMDGFCDTVDALSSHAAPARKLAILKDPHPGAFAVTFCAAYLLGYFALAAQLPRTNATVLLLTLLHGMSRTTGALAALSFPLAGDGGMLSACRSAADGSASHIALYAQFALCAAGMALVSPVAGLGMAAAAAGCALYVRRMSKAQFGGMRGDLVGYLIVISELAMLFCLVTLERWVML